MQDTLNPDRRYLCRHVHTDGRRCGSPALRGQNFCYYHDRQRLQNAPLAGRLGIFRFQPIEDRSAIQIALYDILSRVSAGDLDNKRASILLYGLQIASSNLARQEKLQPATQPLEDVTNHHILGDLAPIEELPTDEPAAPQHPVILSEAVCNANSEVEGPDTPPAPPLPPESFNAEITTALQPPQHPVILSEAVRNANSEVEGRDTPPAPPLPPEPFSPEALNEDSEEDLVLAAGQTTVRHSLTLHAAASIWNRSTRPESPQPAIRLRCRIARITPKL